MRIRSDVIFLMDYVSNCNKHYGIDNINKNQYYINKNIIL